MWLLAKKKILSRNFRVRHAYLSQKYPYPQTPAPAISSFLQLGFWKLGCCVWRLFLETLKSNITVGDTVLAAGARMRFRTMLIFWLWQSLTFGSLAATYEGKGKSPKTPNRELNQNQTKILQHPSPERQGVVALTSSTAQGGGGSFKNRKAIGEVGCCESGMAERSHWWTERCLISLTLSISFSDYLPTYLPIYFLCIYLSIYLSLSLSFI